MQRIIIKSYESRKSIIAPIIFLILGLLLFLNPGNIVEFISYIFGGIFITLGTSKILFDLKRADRTTGDMFYSVIMIILGLIFIFFSGTIEFIIRLIIGVWIIINGLNTIAISSNLVKIDKKSTLSLIIGFILVLMGLYVIFVSNLVLSAIGLVLIVYAVLEIIDYFYIAYHSRH